MPDAFVSPGADLSRDDPAYSYLATLDPRVLLDRWSSQQGQTIINQIVSSNVDRDMLDTLVGKINGKYDLRAIPLTKRNLRGADLSDCDLFSADLTESDLWNANLKGSYLSEATLYGTNLSWIKVRETLVDNVKINRRTQVLGIDLSGINTNFALHFMAEVRDQQRIYDLQQSHPWFAAFLRVTSDYGRSLGRWSIWTAATILLFGVIYTVFPHIIKGISGGLDGFYFSVVTFTTLGFGDIYPVTLFGKVLVMAEVVIGYIMGGVFIAILTRRVLG